MVLDGDDGGLPFASSWAIRSASRLLVVPVLRWTRLPVVESIHAAVYVPRLPRR